MFHTYIEDLQMMTHKIPGTSRKRELNVIIEDDENICASCHKGINSQLWKEFDWKLNMRFLLHLPVSLQMYKNYLWQHIGGNVGKWETIHIYFEIIL